MDYSEQALDLANKLAKDSDVPDLNFFVSIFRIYFSIKSALVLYFVSKFLMGGDSNKFSLY